ncbi:MAG: hypothetical protein ABI599_05815 [Flavobacteriales bacterium]
MKTQGHYWQAGMVLLSLFMQGCCTIMPEWCDEGTPDLDRSRQEERIAELLEVISGHGEDVGAMVPTTGGRSCSAAWAQLHAGTIDSLCAENLPRGARIWFMDEDSLPCWCRCTALDALPQSVRDSLLAARRVSDALGYGSRADSLKPPKAPPSPVFSAGPDSVPEGLPSTAATPCGRTRGYLPFGDGCISISALERRFFDVFPVFRLEVDARAHGSYWPEVYTCDAAYAWREGDPALTSDKVMLIKIPAGFYLNSEVKGELLAFILAHEIGHGLAEGFTCYAGDDRTVCEGEADWWAAEVGLRSVFPDAEFVPIALAARRQLGKYYDWLYGYDATCGWHFCDCDNAACGYPPKDCRQRALSAALDPVEPRRPPCIEAWPRTVDARCSAFSDCP